jgi:hypothetical protein
MKKANAVLQTNSQKYRNRKKQMVLVFICCRSLTILTCYTPIHHTGQISLGWSDPIGMRNTCQGQLKFIFQEKHLLVLLQPWCQVASSVPLMPLLSLSLFLSLTHCCFSTSFFMMLTSEKRKTRPLERNSLLGTDKGEPKGSTGELLPAAQKVSWRLCSVARRSRRGGFLL